MKPTGDPHPGTGPTRRVFLSGRELPGLLFGALRGEPVCLRRLLGARRAGRYGVMGAFVGLALAGAPADWPYVLTTHAAASLAGWAAVGRGAGLSLRAHQRLTLWCASPGLATLGLVGRLLGSPWGGVLGVLVGHALLALHLRGPSPFGAPAATPAPAPSARATSGGPKTIAQR